MKSRARALVAVWALVASTSAGCAVVARGPSAGGEERVLVCHKGKTLEVAEPALAAHLRHGDTRGRCR